MKFIKCIYLVALLLTFSACDEDKILEEVPLDFLTVENAYNTPANFEAAVGQLYNQARGYGGTYGHRKMDVYRGTDLGYHARAWDRDAFSVYESLNGDNGEVLRRWDEAYQLLNNANTILGRIDDIEFDSATQKTTLEAETKFFRAWTYRNLVYLFGGVPILLEEISSARRDYVRASKTEVLETIIEDLKFAKANLPTVDNAEEDGRLTKDVASHFLAETYISTGENQLAINEASEVIDGGKYNLMQNRFGSRIDEPGDIYWDLFRLDNQNRKSGNTESIWVYQVEYLTLGGYGDPAGVANYFERIMGPEYNRFKAKGDTKGKNTFLYESTYHGGRAQAYFRPSAHATHTVWSNVSSSDFENDIRNSKYNVLRKWWIDNPESKYYGDTIHLGRNSKLAYETYTNTSNPKDSTRMIFPTFLKMTQANNHFAIDLATSGNNLSPAQEALATPEHKALIASYNGVGPKMGKGARRVYKDLYAVRLPETLLLRAEAYMNLSQNELAKADINSIRARANASLIDASDVDIDLILDERMRELMFEEPRRITLGRLGLLYERTKKYNYWASTHVQEHNNLYPIPNRDIQNNTEAELTQNPGY